MYQALYRKYRPSKFVDIVGQQVIVTTLKNSVINSKINHAYLFSGPRGTGKTSAAKLFAKLVNCHNNTIGEICGECVFCTQTNNMDIIEIDAASNNGVDEIRELKSKVNLLPTTGKYKIYIIDEVHMLTTNAFNALLKTLEEPPKHIIFILATTEPHKIPETILSRCLRFDFQKINTPSLIERIKSIVDQEKIIIEEKAIELIVKLANGGLRDAISLLDKLIAYKVSDIELIDVQKVNGSLTQEELNQFIKEMLEENLENCLSFIQKIDEEGKNLSTFIDDVLCGLKELCINSFMVKNYQPKTKTSISSIVNKMDIFVALLSETKNLGNIRLLLEIALIKTCTSNNYFPGNKTKETSLAEKSLKLKEVSKNNLNFQKLEAMQKRKDIRVNNALSSFNKKETNIIKEQILSLKQYLFDKDLSEIISMILDGELKIYGLNYLVFLHNNANLSKSFNFKLSEIEKTINDKLDKSYKIVSIDLNDWKSIKEKFNNKKETFQFVEEEPELIINNPNEEENSNEVEEIFKETIEYS